MSFSAQWKQNEKQRAAEGKPSRTFAEYKAVMQRMANARAARGASVAVEVVAKAPVRRESKVARLERELAELKAMIAGNTHEPVQTAPKAPKTVKVETTEYERIEHRVDCFGNNKTGVVTLAVDSADARKAEKALKGLYCLNAGSYNSSGRGERTKLQVQQNQIEKARKALVAAGLTPAGARGWKRAGVTL